MFQNGDDEKWSVFFEADALYGIGVPAFLEEGKEALAEVFYVFGFDVFKDVDVDEVLQEVSEEPMVGEDAFEAVVDCVVNGHKSSMPYYGTGMHGALNFYKKTE